MRYWIIALISIGALIGLVFIQINLLNVGILLEKDRFDLKINSALHQINQSLDQNEELRKRIVSFQQIHNRTLYSPEYTLPIILQDSLSALLSRMFAKQGIAVNHTFALGEGKDNLLFLQRDNYENVPSAFQSYRKRLGGKVANECQCILYLNVSVKHLYNYLLRKLAYLIIPSLLFILTIIGSLFFLIHMLNKQLKLDRIKTDFINNLTHELKTPVFSISLLTKVLRQTIESKNEKKAKEYLKLVDKETLQLKTHIDKVLELASLESGHYQLERKPTEMHQLLTDIAQHYAIKIKHLKGQLNCSFQAKVTNLYVDPVHFKNVIQNLLENALKYNTLPPDIQIMTNGDTSNFVLSIQDNGIGIAPEHQKVIFDKFYRVSTGNLHQVKGFGLGLSYVRQIVEAHGGKVLVFSNLGKGSTFQVRLPIIPN